MTNYLFFFINEFVYFNRIPELLNHKRESFFCAVYSYFGKGESLFS